MPISRAQCVAAALAEHPSKAPNDARPGPANATVRHLAVATQHREAAAADAPNDTHQAHQSVQLAAALPVVALSGEVDEKGSSVYNHDITIVGLYMVIHPMSTSIDLNVDDRPISHIAKGHRMPGSANSCTTLPEMPISRTSHWSAGRCVRHRQLCPSVLRSSRGCT